jgi:hypothetical protein
LQYLVCAALRDDGALMLVGSDDDQNEPPALLPDLTADCWQDTEF